MIHALLISNAILWALVVGLTIVTMALTRQIGLLHERLTPVGALSQQRALAVGEPVPEMTLADLDGDSLTIGGVGERMLIFFLSPSCPVCKTLLPTLRRVVADETPATRLVLASDGGDAEEHREFRREQGLEGETYVLSTELGVRLGVAKLPTAVLLDEAGVLRANGLVNTREQVESLFEAHERGVGSIQELAAREQLIAQTSLLEM